MIKIGNTVIKSNVFMAPMAGISNPSYMKIIEQMGCGMAVTELISAEAIVRSNKKTLEMLNGIEDIKMPVGIQLFGSNAEVLSSAAKIIEKKFNVNCLDINMGCPVPKVAISAHSGSALLKDPDKVFEIVSSVVKSISIPVTVKIRSGWDNNSINAVKVAQKIEKAGASAITIHPRTRSQGYSGQADWSIIKEVKENVSIPVIGNGDIRSCYDAKRMLDETGCDAVMIGRGLMGNPWLVKECIEYLEKGIEPKQVSIEEKIDMIKKHLDLLIKNTNEKVAMLEIRSHAAWYLKGITGSKDLKEKIMKTKSRKELINLLDDFKDKTIL